MADCIHQWSKLLQVSASIAPASGTWTRDFGTGTVVLGSVGIIAHRVGTRSPRSVYDRTSHCSSQHDPYDTQVMGHLDHPSYDLSSVGFDGQRQHWQAAYASAGDGKA